MRAHSSMAGNRGAERIMMASIPNRHHKSDIVVRIAGRRKPQKSFSRACYVIYIRVRMLPRTPG
jgi:hypothetical protein